MNRRLVSGIAIALLCGFALGRVRADDEDDAKKLEKVRKLLAATKEGRDAAQLCREAMSTNTAVSPEFKRRFAKAADAKAFDELFAPVYAKHFDEDDLEAMTAFYESAAGKKLVKKRLTIQKEIGEAGRVWGARLGMKIAGELQGKGDDDDEDEEPKVEPKKEKEKEKEKETPKKKSQDY